MAAIAHWPAHEPKVLALLEACYAARDLQTRFSRYETLAQRALAPVGGLWPADTVNVCLEGEDWTTKDVGAAVAGAAALWHSLVAGGNG